MANVIEAIRTHPKPLDISHWWKEQPAASMAETLDEEEEVYLAVFTSDVVPPVARIGLGIASPSNLTGDERTRAANRFGSGPTSLQQFANYENRRRIIAHYALTHPATVQYELGLYRLSRDVNPVTFIAERVYELFTKKEAFTDEQVSRLRAAVDLLIPMVLSRVLKFIRPGSAVPIGPVRPLESPIWDLPAEGGGMTVNGRWYTEHALERMAPDTPTIRASMRTRVMARLKRLGLNEGSPAWDACYKRAMQKVDPRGVPPSLVEAEIMKPGSTSVKVITARQGKIVVTVIPR